MERVWSVCEIRETKAMMDETFGDSEGRAPLGFEDIEADAPLRVDVGVVNLGRELELCLIQ